MRSLILGLLLTVAAFAADVDGKWTGSLTTPNGDTPVIFNFKADGAALTGTTTGPDGTEIKINNGKVDGNNVNFSVTFDFNGMPILIKYQGVVAKDQISFMLDVFGMPLDLVVKRA